MVLVQRARSNFGNRCATAGHTTDSKYDVDVEVVATRFGERRDPTGIAATFGTERKAVRVLDVGQRLDR